MPGNAHARRSRPGVFLSSVDAASTWLDAAPRRHHAHPMNLTDDEKRDAAMGCRALAHIAEQDSKRTSNSGVRENFEATAMRFNELAAKFEAARAR